MNGNGRGCVAGALAAPGKFTPRTGTARADEAGWLPAGAAPVNSAEAPEPSGGGGPQRDGCRAEGTVEPQIGGIEIGGSGQDRDVPDRQL